ncbi:tripartite tricarboxylate transporter substrate binding protein [Pigmentiphaga soli]|uniref:Tripartite tricarboxylate transporter substrate binding protein n=1 Tax=Pigmentiphaga soli TaxID=1007095 RepID=A0ABP8HG63_9BURK
MQQMIRSMAAALLGAALLAPAGASAQASYPARPVRLLVGFPPGSASDVAARIVSQKLGPLLGQTVVVENRPGASSNIAAKAVADAAPDGYVLFFSTVANVINTAGRGSQVVDIGTQLTPVGMIGAVPNILVVNPSLGVDTLPAFITLLKSRPGQVAYGSAGTGTALHMAAELFSMMAGVKMLHVPYQGSAPAVTDLVGGQTQVMFAPASTVLPFVKSGKLKAIASTGLRRTDSAPDLPTIDELGLKGFESTVWYGIEGPPGLPANVTATLEKAIQTAAADPDVQSQFKAQGIESNVQDHAAFGAYIRSETEKWTNVVKASGIKLE